MITKQQFEAGIKCNGMCKYGSEFCTDIFSCYQYQSSGFKNNMTRPKTAEMLWKEVIYKGEIYNCLIDIEDKTIIVNDKDGNNLFNIASPLESFIDECKFAVKEAYKFTKLTELEPTYQYKLFADWDGNMDIDE